MGVIQSIKVNRILGINLGRVNKLIMDRIIWEISLDKINTIMELINSLGSLTIKILMLILLRTLLLLKEVFKLRMHLRLRMVFSLRILLRLRMVFNLRILLRLRIEALLLLRVLLVLKANLLFINQHQKNLM